MKKYLMGIALAAMASSVGAQDRIKLWQNVEQGMQLEEVQAFYPDGKYKKSSGTWDQGVYQIKGFEPIPGCGSTVNLHFENGGIQLVEIRGKGAIGGNCSSALESALVGKYGYPPETSAGWAWWGATQTRQQGWMVDGVMMRYFKLDGQGLASASWVMEYAAQKRVGNVGL